MELSGREKDERKKEPKEETVFSEEGVMCRFEEKETLPGGGVGPPGIWVKAAYYGFRCGSTAPCVSTS